jgi:histidyl-tRNA synthetase
LSLGHDRIIVVMTERGMFPASVATAPADVMVALWNEDSRAHALDLASTLRRAGWRVDVYPEADKPGRQFKYAASRAYPLVVLAGADEQRSGTVTVKNMRTAEQLTVPRDAMAEQVKRWL